MVSTREHGKMGGVQNMLGSPEPALTGRAEECFAWSLKGQVNNILLQVDREGFCWLLRSKLRAVATGGSHHSMREFLPPWAGGHCSTSLQRCWSRCVASSGRRGADREVVLVLLTVAVFSLQCFMGFEPSVSSPFDVVERSAMEGVEVKERFYPFYRRR